MTQFHSDSHSLSKAELRRVLSRLPISPETIAEITAQLPDPVNLDEAGRVLQRYGLTRDALISQLGGSP